MKAGSLFSGIGGFDLGLERAGMTVKWQVEIDDFCNKVLAKHWPNVKRYRDVKEVGKHNLEPVDLICGGFPCQPFSVAGKRRGTEDDRHLWPEMFRVIDELRPRWVIGENVAGFINMGLDQSISDLEGIGYEVGTFVIPACAVNAPHRRDRVWIIAQNSEHGFTHPESDASHAIDEGRVGWGGGGDADPVGVQESEQAGREPRGTTTRCNEEPVDAPHAAPIEDDERNGGIVDSSAQGGPRIDPSARSGDQYVTDPSRELPHGGGGTRGGGTEHPDGYQYCPHCDGWYPDTSWEWERGYCPDCGKWVGFFEGIDYHVADAQGPGLERRNTERPGRTDVRDTEHAVGNKRKDQSESWDEPWPQVAARLCRVDDGVSDRVHRTHGISGEPETKRDVSVSVQKQKNKTSAGRTHRLKALGNAVVPQIPEIFGRAIMEVERDGRDESRPYGC
ncbi:DNA cytosine methyltransferase [Candidatus Pacearchaeota archaeon]|nr:DNA cytosine methyltransferase [Candidatus Pacearchaeota archaeon]